MYNLTVYVKNDCGACNLVLSWFENNGVVVTEVINAEEEPEVMDYLIKKGFMQFPVVSLNQFRDAAFSGFELAKMEEIKERVV